MTARERVESIARMLTELTEFAEQVQEKQDQYKPVMLIYLLSLAMAEVDELRRQSPPGW